MPWIPHSQAFSVDCFQSRGSCPAYCHLTPIAEILGFWGRINGCPQPSGVLSGRWFTLLPFQWGWRMEDGAVPEPQESPRPGFLWGWLILFSLFMPPAPNLPCSVTRARASSQFGTRIFLALQANLKACLLQEGSPTAALVWSCNLWPRSYLSCPVQGTEVRADLGMIWACLSAFLPPVAQQGGWFTPAKNPSAQQLRWPQREAGCWEGPERLWPTPPGGSAPALSLES